MLIVLHVFFKPVFLTLPSLSLFPVKSPLGLQNLPFIEKSFALDPGFYFSYNLNFNFQKFACILQPQDYYRTIYLLALKAWSVFLCTFSISWKSYCWMDSSINLRNQQHIFSPCFKINIFLMLPIKLENLKAKCFLLGWASEITVFNSLRASLNL